MNDRLTIATALYREARRIADPGQTLGQIADLALMLADTLIAREIATSRDALDRKLEARRDMADRRWSEVLDRQGAGLSQSDVDAAVDFVRERVAGTPHAFRDSHSAGDSQ